MCGTFEYGLNAAAKEFDGKNKYIRITDIDDVSREFLLSDLSSPDICLDGMSKYLLSSGDIVFARTGASVGKTYIYRENDGIVYFAGFLIRAKVNQDNDAEFVFQNTLSPSYEKYIRITSQRSGQPGVNAQEYGEYDLFTPSKEEQQRIGQFLRGIDHLITLHQRKVHINTKRPMRLSENERSLKTISWEQRKLSEMCGTFEYGLNAAAKEFDGKNKYIRITDIDDVSREFLLSDLSSPDICLDGMSKYLLSSGDIVFARTGASVGKTYIYRENDGIVYFAGFLIRAKVNQDNDAEFVFQSTLSPSYEKYIRITSQRSGQPGVNAQEYGEHDLFAPSKEEQQRIGQFLRGIDNLITLHQRKSPSRKNWRCVMIKETRGIDLFHEYYAKWITVYKKGAIRKVTMDKYLMTQKWLEKLIPDLRVCDMNRIAYQQLLNDYAEHHERQTTMDFHHQLKGAILDAVDEGLIDRDPTRKAIIKGRTPTSKKVKYLNQFELHTLLTSLELKNEVNWDYFILLVAKTGMRFSEALALTPKDFDFSHQTLSINKTWDYKGKGGFQPTKNKSSIRKIQIDWQTVIQFSELVKGFPKDQPIFVKSNVYNSTVNDILGRYCERSNIPVISIHGLRHTHASLLLFAGVSIASVARRLGHSSMTTTQKTYLHIIQELENKDIDLVMRSLSGLS